MNKSQDKRNRAFTLIELLVVIAVIALLAGMIFPITGAVQKAKARSKARAELAQVATWIESYKVKLGHYPPDNPNPLGRAVNPLYYELAGTVMDPNGTAYRTLDNSSTITKAEITGTFGIGGFVNSSRGAGGEDAVGARAFVKDLKPGQVGQLLNGVKLLACSVAWPQTTPPSDPTATAGLNPFRYNSSNPTNNPGSYDLWVDIVVGGKTNRICNWSREPLIVNSPY